METAPPSSNSNCPGEASRLGAVYLFCPLCRVSGVATKHGGRKTVKVQFNWLPESRKSLRGRLICLMSRCIPARVRVRRQSPVTMDKRRNANWVRHKFARETTQKKKQLLFAVPVKSCLQPTLFLFFSSFPAASPELRRKVLKPQKRKIKTEKWKPTVAESISLSFISILLSTP